MGIEPTFRAYSLSRNRREAENNLKVTWASTRCLFVYSIVIFVMNIYISGASWFHILTFFLSAVTQQ